MRAAASCAGLAALLACGCGYRAVYGGEGGERLHVHLARAPVAGAVAADEVASGVREELAREGALAGGDGFPRVEVEVLRLDESTDAVRAARDGAAALAPSARGTEVGVVARAWIVAREGAAPERDTGDFRAIDLVAVAVDRTGSATSTAAATDMLAHDDAQRAAARRVGVRLAQRLLGWPAPADESSGR